MKISDILLEENLSTNELEELRSHIDALKGIPEYEELVKKAEEVYKAHDVPEGPVNIEQVKQNILSGKDPVVKEIDAAAQKLAQVPRDARLSSLKFRRNFRNTVFGAINNTVKRLSKQHRKSTGEYITKIEQRNYTLEVRLAIYGWMTERYLERSSKNPSINMIELTDGAHKYWAERKTLIPKQNQLSAADMEDGESSTNTAQGSGSQKPPVFKPAKEKPKTDDEPSTWDNVKDTVKGWVGYED